MTTNDRWVATLTLLLMLAFFGQAVMSMVVKSPTVDEQAHLTRGYLYLAQGNVPFKIGHPILANTLNALPVWALVDLSLPSDPALWQDNRWGEFADRFIWQSCDSIDTIFFLGRYITVAIGLLFAALVSRWANQLWHGQGALIALGLFVFDPNIVAHSRLVTDDIAVSFLFFATTYFFWQYLESDHKLHLAATGITFGLAQSCKFSALMLVPVLIAVAVCWAFLHRRNNGGYLRGLVKGATDLLIVVAVGFVTTWAVYGFEVRPFHGGSIPIPATSYFEDLIWETHYLGKTGYVFLNGVISSTGWWYYFLFAFLVKSPLPALVLIGVGVIVRRRDLPTARLGALLLPPFLYAISTLVVRLNIGYRFFIPVLPYLYVLASGTTCALKRHRRLLIAGALVWSAAVSFSIFPNYLSYFNIIAGGPSNGYKFLVDSNVDWGQDLPALQHIVETEDLGRIKLSYFGTAHPSCYSIDFEPLPTWAPAPQQGNPATRTYTPLAPSPGIYAISATNLQGVVFSPQDQDTFAWFRTQEPFNEAGHSILLYRVEPSGPPINVALTSIQIDQLTTETIARFGSNDLRLRWFDASTSLVIPAEPGWLVAGWPFSGVDAWPDGQRCSTSDLSPCAIYPPDAASHAAALAHIDQLSITSRAWTSPELFPSSPDELLPLSLPVALSDELSFLGYDLSITDIVSITTAWRVSAPPSGPRAIFVHLLAADGSVTVQWDGLDVPMEGWRPGDTIIQRVFLPLPDVPTGSSYWLQAGVYNPSTLERLPVIVNGSRSADRILLEPIGPGATP